VRVDHDSADTLILCERATVLRAVGVVFAGLGVLFAGMGVDGYSKGDGTIAPIVFGAISLAVGGLMIVLPMVHTFAFSRAQRRLVIVRQRLGKTIREEYPLGEVAGARLDESKSSDDGSSWRVVVQLSDGRVVPVTSYYSSGAATKADAVNRINAFLARHAPVVSTNPIAAEVSAFTAVAVPPGPGWKTRGGLLAFGFLFVAIGTPMMWREHIRLTKWLPTQATVLSSRVQEVSDDDGSTYRPVVVYRYFVDDRTYTSSRVTPISESRSGGWANRVVSGFAVGGTYPAWYDPANPGDAFLLRSRSIVALVFTIVGAVIASSALLIDPERRRRRLF
jgi:hypothetical protein